MIKEYPSMEELKSIIGSTIPALKMTSEWQELVVMFDSFTIESIDCTVDVETGNLSNIMLRGFASKSGFKKFDTWLDVSSLVKYNQASERAKK